MLQQRRREGGNAVTLTLLGLAVAILAGVVVLFYIGKTAPQPVPLIEPADTTSEEVADEEENPRASWRTYTDPTYEFSLQYPPGWVVATGTLFGDPAISVYPQVGATGTPPYSHQNVGLPHVSVYPHGLSTEGLFVEAHQSEIIVPVPEASAKDYRVSSGRPWGTLARFTKYPPNWNEYGFAFAGANIEELEFGCMQSGAEVALDECNYFEGDRMLVHGFVDASTRELAAEILRSLSFVAEEEATSTSMSTDDLIQVESPVSGELISSPLTVSGTARGSWYFEGDFPVRLETADGEVLAQVPATALEDWMTEEYVPFEVSVAFDVTTATSGRLLLIKDNPSDFRELDAQLVIPVTFTHDEE